MTAAIDYEQRAREDLASDLDLYAEQCLTIRSKDGALIPLKLNLAQRFVHEQIEKQRSLVGRVRAIILKGRQQGVSSYVQGRFYHQVTHGHGLRAYILTHEIPATETIFEIADRYHDHCPPEVKPSTGAANAKELRFDLLDSGYRVGTAGTKGGGRSQTIQLFHGSEVAYWPNAETHMSGVMQAVPGGPGSEVILESTAAGATGLFHQKWDDAVAGRSDYIAIFVPWFWQTEYRADATGFVPTAEEENYAEEHGLDLEQLAWRRAKILELHGIWHFRHEYPATPKEAFDAESPGALWTRKLIERDRVQELPALRRGAVAVDPSTTSKATSNAAGVIWGYQGVNGHVYIVGDESMRGRPVEWARRAVRVYDENDLERLVYESNQGGEMVEDIINAIDRTADGKKKRSVSMRGVHASRGKRARAEPVQSLCEQGLVHHVGCLPALEDELCTWDSETSNESPNILDAYVWLVHHFLIRAKSAGVKAPDPNKGSTGRKWNA